MSAARPGALATMLPSMKKVARMPRSASARVNSGVDSGSGPSSKVSATWPGSPWPANRRKASMRTGPMPVTPGPACATASPAAPAAPSQAAERQAEERQEGDRQEAAASRPAARCIGAPEPRTADPDGKFTPSPYSLNTGRPSLRRARCCDSQRRISAPVSITRDHVSVAMARSLGGPGWHCIRGLASPVAEEVGAASAVYDAPIRV